MGGGGGEVSNKQAQQGSTTTVTFTIAFEARLYWVRLSSRVALRDLISFMRAVSWPDSSRYCGLVK
mgnify:CR=1 FL=1